MVDLKYLGASTLLSYGSYLVINELFNTINIDILWQVSWFFAGFSGIVLATLLMRDFSIDSVKLGVVSGIIAQILGLAIFANLNLIAGMITGDSLLGQVASASSAYLTIFGISNILTTSKAGSQIVETAEKQISKVM